MSADRNVFAFLKLNHKPRGTGRPTVFYMLNVDDGLHRTRLKLMGAAYDKAGKVSESAA
jgi:hypothetical protein